MAKRWVDGNTRFPKRKGHAAARAAVKDLMSWNRVTIQAKGDQIQTWINGVPCANLNNSERDSGFIALQVHQGNKGTIRWRNPRVKDLSAE